MNGPGIAGDALPARDPATLISTMTVSLQPLDLIVQWRRCSVAADFLADYFSYLFERREHARDILSSGLNEVIENLAKFSADKREPVTVTVTHFGEHLRIATRNVARAANARALAVRLDRMALEDPEELFLAQLEHTAEHDHAASGLGLITIKKDFGALLGAAFAPVEGSDGLVAVEFHLEFDTDAIEQA